MTGTNPEILGFLGLGVMGSAECHNLLRKSGHPVVVFDPKPDNLGPLVAAGATAAGSAGEVAAAADIVFLSLPGGPEVSSVLYDTGGILDSARPGTLVVDLSTTPVGIARAAHERLAQRQCGFLDAPVARTRKAAIAGTLAIMAGGTAADFARAEPLLRTMGTDVTHCGPAGAGALLKLVNNTVVFETVVALAEAVTLARRSGLVADEVLFDVLGGGSAGSFALENHGRSALLPDVHPTGIFPAAYMRKDIGYTLDVAAELGVELPAATLAHSLLDRLCDEGFADNYHTAVVRLLDKAGS
ncbi:NAD(P)-dependent oxidoreductase [Nocardia sp. alder85J]|uniref:NAD(P)-dependent oxidoreductase n=1 Tax=Nocardia sp. alder85J TaxID=2862949 RepID=UPI001CD4DAD7|nr:NAD(P)-dependent oxidoreductase [Nocardia sp. alder85J]MCX4094646.1 NAD(P)-dependent oxidoreductase [Nocardia sp. alder85J]